jgi:hypothetical protein
MPKFRLRQVSLYFITVYPDDGCNKKLKYVVCIVTRKEVIYSYTCLKTESGHNQTHIQQNIFTVHRTGSNEHPNFNYLYKIKPTCNKKKFQSLVVPL